MEYSVRLMRGSRRMVAVYRIEVLSHTPELTDDQMDVLCETLDGRVEELQALIQKKFDSIDVPVDVEVMESEIL